MDYKTLYEGIYKKVMRSRKNDWTKTEILQFLTNAELAFRRKLDEQSSGNN